MKSPDCISYAIAIGGDVDTTVGTRVGVHNTFHDLGEWTFTELKNIGKRAYKLVARFSCLGLSQKYLPCFSF
jgi:hypothetical protein